MSYIKRGPGNVESITVDTIGNKGKMTITQLMGKDRAFTKVQGWSDDFDSTIHFLHMLEMEPGTEIGAHTHNGEEEIYFIAEGAGEVTVDGETIPMGKGDAILTKDGSTHSFKVTSATPAKLFVVEAGVK